MMIGLITVYKQPLFIFFIIHVKNINLSQINMQ